MNSLDSFQQGGDAMVLLSHQSADKLRVDVAPPVDGTPRNPRRLPEFRPSILMGAALIASELMHLTLLWVTGADWSGPLSLRKPSLFGVSGRVTIWSIA